MIFDADKDVCILSSEAITWIDKNTFEQTKAINIYISNIHIGKLDTIIFAQNAFYRLIPSQRKLDKLIDIGQYVSDFSIIPEKSIIYFVLQDTSDPGLNNSINYFSFDGEHKKNIFNIKELQSDSFELRKIECFEKEDTLFMVYNANQAFAGSYIKTVNLNTGQIVNEQINTDFASGDLYQALQPDYIRSIYRQSTQNTQIVRVTDAFTYKNKLEWSFDSGTPVDITPDNLLHYDNQLQKASLYDWNSNVPKLQFKTPFTSIFYNNVNLFKHWMSITSRENDEGYLFDFLGKAQYKLTSIEGINQVLYADEKIAVAYTKDNKLLLYKL